MTRRNISTVERRGIEQAWGYACAYCKSKEGPFAVDHIVPHSKGGSCDLDNLCWACESCNARKHNDRLPIFYEGLLLAKAKRNAEKTRRYLKSKTDERPRVSRPVKEETRQIHFTIIDRLPKCIKFLTCFLKQDIREEPLKYNPTLGETTFGGSKLLFNQIFGTDCHETICECNRLLIKSWSVSSFETIPIFGASVFEDTTGYLEVSFPFTIKQLRERLALLELLSASIQGNIPKSEVDRAAVNAFRQELSKYVFKD